MKQPILDNGFEPEKRGNEDDRIFRIVGTMAGYSLGTILILGTPYGGELIDYIYTKSNSKLNWEMLQFTMIIPFAIGGHYAGKLFATLIDKKTN